MADYFDVAVWSLIGGLISLAGGILLLIKKNIAYKFAHFSAPFAAGALLGAAFFDLLPEAVEINAEGAAFRWAVAGILLFFILEHYLHWFHHHHEHENVEFKRLRPSLIIIGDTVHNAIDGVVIGAAFAISLPVGIVTTIAVAAHEIPQEIGDFGLLLKAGLRRMRVLIINVASALITLVAALYTFHLGSNETLPLGAILGLAAGLFIYIAASDIIPLIHEKAAGKFAKFSTVLLLMGVLLVAVVTDFTHEKLHDDTASDGKNSHQEVHHDSH